MQSRHLFAWLLLLPPLSALSDSVPQQSGEQNFVVRAVVVKDSRDRPLKGLSARDFTVIEDGVPRDIVFFKFQDLARQISPRKLSPTASAAPGGTVLYDGRRLLVLYFQLSAMSAAEQEGAQTAAREFVETRMASQDLAIVASDEDSSPMLADFTND